MLNLIKNKKYPYMVVIYGYFFVFLHTNSNM